MSGTRSRTKGRKAQTEGSALLTNARWQVVDTSAGRAVEDVFAIDPAGDQWSVEITADQQISLRAKWKQTTTQATNRNASPLLLWRFDHGGWWLVGSYEVSDRRREWDEVTFEPPVHKHPRAVVKAWWSLRPLPKCGAMPVFLLPGGLTMAPAFDALEDWWRT